MNGIEAEFLDRLGTEKKSAFVAHWLVSAIERGRFKVGDKLPPQRVLAEKLNVSRTAVREALSSLQAAGVVEPKVGDGTYVVSAVSPKADIEELIDALRESGTLAELWRVRRDLESVVSELAARKATRLDLEYLNACLKRIREAMVIKDPDEYLEANNELHLALVNIARNPFLKRALIPLLEITSHQLSKVIDADYLIEHSDDIFFKHEEIVLAIQNRDLERIVDIVKEHFEASEALFLGEAT